MLHDVPLLLWLCGRLIFQRINTSGNQPVIVEQDINGDTIRTVLSTSDLNGPVGGGVRFLIGKRLQEGWAIEGSYLGLIDTHSTAQVTNNDPSVILTFPGPLGPASNVFFGSNHIRTDYTSSLHSVEVNFVCCCCKCDDCHHDCSQSQDSCGDGPRPCQSVEWLGGFRYVYLPENFHIFGERTELGLPETGFYDVSTFNNLFGAQVDGRFRRCAGKWGWKPPARPAFTATMHNNDRS